MPSYTDRTPELSFQYRRCHVQIRVTGFTVAARDCNSPSGVFMYRLPRKDSPAAAQEARLRAPEQAHGLTLEV
jgi:hypothetical protein